MTTDALNCLRAIADEAGFFVDAAAISADVCPIWTLRPAHPGHGPLQIGCRATLSQRRRRGPLKKIAARCRIPKTPFVVPTPRAIRRAGLSGEPIGQARTFGLLGDTQRKATMSKNTICLWYSHDAEEAARFYAKTFPDSAVGAVHRAPSDYPGGKAGNVLTVEFTVCGVPCLGLNGGDMFKHSEAFSFQIATDDQAETDRYWNAIVGNGGAESQCGWCKDKWGLSWQITPRALTDAMAKGGDVAKRAFAAMMPMKKIDVARIEAAVRG